MTRFVVLDGEQSVANMRTPVVLLRPTHWDDWFQYETTYEASYRDSDNRSIYLGEVKIGQFGLKPESKGNYLAQEPPRLGVRQPDLPRTFETLSSNLFSLGQSADYYERLTAIGTDFREHYLTSLRDIAFDEQLRTSALAEPVTGVSLLRYVPRETLDEQFARLARGGDLLTEYSFVFRQGLQTTPPRRDGYEIRIDVAPRSKPPTNVHVVVGRNGVGKSTLLHEIALAATDRNNTAGGTIQRSDGAHMAFPNVVLVSFSAFDEFEPVSVPRDRSATVVAHYIGLKRVDGDGLKTRAALAGELTKAAKDCLHGERLVRLMRTARLLEADPIFSDIGLSDRLSSAKGRTTLETEMSDLFRRLSSGHKIVLLTMVKLVQTLAEKTLVLIDEPEAHLHPPLLSAYVRALSDLLTTTNGVAVLATHSPVVLQEAPRTCVTVLSRSGWQVDQARPTVETFGEAVGLLTDEVFGLEVSSTGYHKILLQSVAEGGSLEDILEEFSGQVGQEGRILVRSELLAIRQTREGHVAR